MTNIFTTLVDKTINIIRTFLGTQTKPLLIIFENHKDTAMTIKKFTMILNAVVITDTMTKASLELLPNDSLEFIDSIPEKLACIIGAKSDCTENDSDEVFS